MAGQSRAGLTLVARSEGDLNRLAEDLGHAGDRPLVCRADISDYDACRKAVENTLERFGRTDSLVNNAGIVQPIAAISDSDQFFDYDDPRISSKALEVFGEKPNPDKPELNIEN
jgi:NAD(P)-dependent dehydrogenase (short-subunit alcohol dehydrogenase family)